MEMRKLTNEEIAWFCKSLALLLGAGINLGDGLFLLAEDGGACKELLETMGQKADAGAVLSQSMEESGCFPVYVTGMVKVGERTGRLEEALLALAGYYEEQERMSVQIKNALTYPSMLMLLMIVVIGVLLVRVLPVFDEVYASLGGRLTGVAGGLLQLGKVLDAAMPLLCVILAAAAVFLFLFAGNEAFRNKVIFWWRIQYGDKGVSKKMNDAHFAQALSMGLQSGLPVEEAVELAGDILREIPEAAKRCEACVDGLANGEGLAEVLKKNDVLPVSFCRMLDLGFKSGRGDSVMVEIAERLSYEASQALEQKISQVEPVMVMTASVLVGMILMSVMLPLMNIMTAIG